MSDTPKGSPELANALKVIAKHDFGPVIQPVPRAQDADALWIDDFVKQVKGVGGLRNEETLRLLDIAARLRAGEPSTPQSIKTVYDASGTYLGRWEYESNWVPADDLPDDPAAVDAPASAAPTFEFAPSGKYTVSDSTVRMTAGRLPDSPPVFSGPVQGFVHPRDVSDAEPLAAEKERNRAQNHQQMLDARGLTRDFLGERVREAWVRWAKDQTNPKPHWLAPWAELSEAEREADRQIGVSIALWTILHPPAVLICPRCKMRPCMEQVDDSWGPDFCIACGPCLLAAASRSSAVPATVPHGEPTPEVERLISKMIGTTYHGDDWHAEFRDDILAIVRASSQAVPAVTDAEVGALLDGMGVPYPRTAKEVANARGVLADLLASRRSGPAATAQDKWSDLPSCGVCGIPGAKADVRAYAARRGVGYRCPECAPYLSASQMRELGMSVHATPPAATGGEDDTEKEAHALDVAGAMDVGHERGVKALSDALIHGLGLTLDPECETAACAIQCAVEAKFAPRAATGGEDTARLDWLDDGTARVMQLDRITMLHGREGWLIREWDEAIKNLLVSVEGRTLRAAIDNARDAARSAGEGKL